MRKLLRFAAIVTLAGGGLAAGAAALVPYLGQMATAHTAKVPEIDQLRELAQRSVMYDRDGNVLQVLRADENRVFISLSKVPALVQNAVLDVEDNKFWQHNGVNLRSTARALAANVESGGIAQGGSTITQQLVKDALLTPERSLERKSKEAMLALRLEKQMTKEQILERYLNSAYFGYDAYGIQAAAETYFGVNATDLTVPQAAFLAGIIRNPSGYDPVRFPELALERRNVALERMVVEGHLGAAEAEAMKKEPLPAPAPNRIQPGRDYFVEEVKQQLLRDERLGATPQERFNAVFKGGLKIVTTIDPRLQAEAKTELETILTDKLRKDSLPCPDLRAKEPDGLCDVSATIASVEPATGAVRAFTVRSDFAGETQFNPITDGLGRQPGSSFKPFVLVAALENGFGPNDIINGSSPCMVPLPGQSPPEWDPGNYEGSAGGIVPIRSATAASLNCAYARMGLLVGLDKVENAAYRLGVRNTPLRHDIVSMPLGSIEVHSLDMASAYATLAADGAYRKPTFVQEVRDRNDKVIFTGVNPGEAVVSPQVARMATSVLQSVVNGGTGHDAALRGRQVAGKTGTAQNYQDAWFVGYTPQLSTAVWMGSPQGQVPMYGVGNVGRVTGGSYPARIWHGYMEQALANQPPVPFAEPDPAAVPRATVLPDPLRCSAYAGFTQRRGGAGSSAGATSRRSTRRVVGGGGNLGGRVVNPANGTCSSSSFVLDRLGDSNVAAGSRSSAGRRSPSTTAKRRSAPATTRARVRATTPTTQATSTTAAAADDAEATPATTAAPPSSRAPATAKAAPTTAKAAPTTAKAAAPSTKAAPTTAKASPAAKPAAPGGARSTPPSAKPKT